MALTLVPSKNVLGRQLCRPLGSEGVHAWAAALFRSFVKSLWSSKSAFVPLRVTYPDTKVSNESCLICSTWAKYLGIPWAKDRLTSLAKLLQSIARPSPTRGGRCAHVIAFENEKAIALFRKSRIIVKAKPDHISIF